MSEHRPNGCCDYHRHIADGCCHCETSVPPTQPPAAPETDVRLREALHRAFHDHWGGPNEPLNLYADSPLWQKQAEAVERIVAERVRVIEGERDAAESSRQEWQAVAASRQARAESAEAAHAALVAAVEALADEWVAATCITDGAPCTFHRHAAGYAADLRALLAGGEE